ncbi:MAG: hypothetical protein QOG53_1653 [Frankiales bacterium]|nr:hypothetical protein [Frankiales bacterium]
MVAGASNLIGGPFGRRALPNRRTLALIALVGFVLVTCGFAWLQKLPCRDPGNWTNNYQYTRVCYSDVVALYYSEELVGNRDPNTGAGDRIKVPYVDHKVEYPVVIGGLMWLAAEGTNFIHPDDPQIVLKDDGTAVTVDHRAPTFFDLTALLMTISAVIVVIAMSATHRRRPWDAALFALAPALVFHAFTNWDLAAAAFAALALLAWSKRYPWVAGVFIGLGAATKLYPALFLLPMFVLCLRSRRLGSWFVATITAVLAWGAVNLPVMRTHYDSWRTFYDLNRSRPADFDTWWYQIRHAVDPGDAAWIKHTSTLNIGVAVAVGIGLVVVCALIWWAPRRPRLPQVLFLALATFLLLNKVYSPQYVIWLIPLAALARPKWRAFLFWQATEIGLLVARYIFFIGLSKSGEGISYGWFQAAVILRDAALIYLMVCVVIEILRPQYDVVRREGDDDPAGGVLDAAPDRRGARLAPYTPVVSAPA